MMLLLAHVLLHGALGAALAPRSGRPGARPSAPINWWPLCAALYLDLLTLAPLVAYQLRLWPAYVFAYAFDPLLLPELYAAVPYACLGVLVALPLSLAVSYALSATWVAAGRPNLAAAQSLACLLACSGVLLAFREDWLTIADFGSFWRGGGTPIWQHVHAQATALAYLAAACGLWLQRARALRA